MCKYCENKENNTPLVEVEDHGYLTEGITACLEKNKLIIDNFFEGCGGLGGVITINYCPMCGRKLSD